MVLSAVPITIHFPEPLWHTVQALAPREGDPATVILRAVEESARTAVLHREAHTIVKARSRAIRRFFPSSGAPTGNHAAVIRVRQTTASYGGMFAPSTSPQGMATADFILATIAERQPRDQLAETGWAVVAVLGALRERFEKTPAERAFEFSAAKRKRGSGTKMRRCGLRTRTEPFRKEVPPCDTTASVWSCGRV